jgi:hypothetical protein
MTLSPRRLLLCTALLSALLAMAFAGSASASRELINGYDNDYHCAGGSDDPCGFFNAMVPWITGAAPDPSKPVLVLDRDGTTDPDCGTSCNSNGVELDTSLTIAFGPGGLNYQVVDPRSPEFAALPLDVNHYSAMIVASDVNCGGCDLNNLLAQPDSDALAARKADILNFFLNGGGVMAFSGGEVQGGELLKTRGSSSGSPARCAHYYDFLPIAAPSCAVGDSDVTTTTAGQGIGLQDVYYEESHNAFQAPDPSSPLQIGAVLSSDIIKVGQRSGSRGEGGVDGTPQTLFADVPNQPTVTAAASAATCTGSFTVSDPGGMGPKAVHYKVDGGAEQVLATPAGTASVTFPAGSKSVEFWGESATGAQEATHHTLTLTGCAVPAAPRISVAGVRRACTSSSSIHVRISVTAPGKVKSVVVSLDGKKIKTTSKSRFTLRINLKKLTAGRHSLRTVVTDQAGSRKTSTRTIARCAAAKPRRQAAPRFTG